MLPDKLDPDDYIKKYGLNDFNKLLESPYDINGFNYEILKKSKKNSNSITDNTIFYENILEFLTKVDTYEELENKIIMLLKDKDTNNKYRSITTFNKQINAYRSICITNNRLTRQYYSPLHRIKNTKKKETSVYSCFSILSL